MGPKSQNALGIHKCNEAFGKTELSARNDHAQSLGRLGYLPSSKSSAAGQVDSSGWHGVLLVPNREKDLAGIETACVRRLGNVDDRISGVGRQPSVDLLQGRQEPAPAAERGLVPDEQLHLHDTSLRIITPTNDNAQRMEKASVTAAA
jgi:hypothetical protein